MNLLQSVLYFQLQGSVLTFVCTFSNSLLLMIFSYFPAGFAAFVVEQVLQYSDWKELCFCLLIERLAELKQTAGSLVSVLELW